MPNQERTPLQEIMLTIESSVKNFGLPPLPAVSSIIPPKKEEKPKEVNQPVIPFVTDVEEVKHPEPDVPAATTNPELAHIDFDSAKMNVYSSRPRDAIPPKSEILVRNVLSEESGS